MRIVIAAGIYPPDIGGPATYVERLSHYLVDRGHAVTVLCYSDRPRRVIVDHVHVHGIGRNTLKVLTALKYFVALYRAAASADIIYAQGPVAGGVQSVLVSRVRRIRFVVKVTGDYAWEQHSARYQGLLSVDAFQNYRGPLPIIIVLLRWLERYVTRHAYRVIVPSVYLSKIVAGWGTPDTRMQVIYNGVACTPASPEGDNAKQKLGLHGRVILYAGRLVPWKGLTAVVAAVSKLHERIPDVILCIVGDGPSKTEVEKTISETGSGAFVHLVSKRSAEELSVYYDSADVFVLNSRYEGLSHVLLEAQCHGVPCTASRAGGNLEVIIDGESGLLFKYDSVEEITESVFRLLSNPDLSAHIRKTATEGLRKFFSLARMHSETETLLADCIEKKS